MVNLQTKSNNTKNNKPINYPKEVSKEQNTDDSNTTMYLEHYTPKKARIESGVLDVLMIEYEVNVSPTDTVKKR